MGFTSNLGYSLLWDYGHIDPVPKEIRYMFFKDEMDLDSYLRDHPLPDTCSYIVRNEEGFWVQVDKLDPTITNENFWLEMCWY